MARGARRGAGRGAVRGAALARAERRAVEGWGAPGAWGACVGEFRAFMAGGVAGEDRLGAVYRTIFRHFAIADPRAQRAALRAVGLRPAEEGRLKRLWVRPDDEPVWRGEA